VKNENNIKIFSRGGKIEKPLNPPFSPFFKGGKRRIFYRGHSKKALLPLKREAGRDFWECL
jgi:hypothetical protein